MSDREVREIDFRKPEFRDAKVEDYEFRGDGALVRKDRWMTGIYSICSLVGLSGRDFEISAVVDAVGVLTRDSLSWQAECDADEFLGKTCVVDVKLQDGCVLTRVQYACGKAGTSSQAAKPATWLWRGMDVPGTVEFWRETHFPESVDLPAEASAAE